MVVDTMDQNGGKKMKEFIEELKHNQAINEQKGLENRVNIDYIIERLEDIEKFLLENIEFFTYHNKNLTKEQDYRLTLIYDNLKSKGVFKNENK